MVLNLKNGEQITIFTPQGIIVIGAREDTGATLVTVGSNEGHTLIHEVTINEGDGQEDFLTWIEPAAVGEEEAVTLHLS